MPTPALIGLLICDSDAMLGGEEGGEREEKMEKKRGKAFGRIVKILENSDLIENKTNKRGKKMRRRGNEKDNEQWRWRRVKEMRNRKFKCPGIRNWS